MQDSNASCLKIIQFIIGQDAELCSTFIFFFKEVKSTKYLNPIQKLNCVKFYNPFTTKYGCSIGIMAYDQISFDVF